MLLQILITTLALTALALLWLFVQRLTYMETSTSSGDYLQGRWGCGDCSITEDCVLKIHVGKKESGPGASSHPPRNPDNRLPG